MIGVDNTRTKLVRTEHNVSIQHGLIGETALQGGYFRRVNAHYYSSRACGQRVSVDFVTQALIRVGYLKVSYCGVHGVIGRLLPLGAFIG